MIVQSSLLGDLSSTGTRQLLLNKTSIQHIIEFPKKSDDITSQVFETVLQGTCIYQFHCKKPSMAHAFKNLRWK